MIKLAILTTLAVTALPSMAAEYVLGRDYQPCEDKLTTTDVINYRKCTIPGAKKSYSEVYTADDGSQRVMQVKGFYLAACSESRVCSITRSETYQEGSYVGDAQEGKYLLTYKFYMGEDYNGNPVAYAVGRGPKFKEDPVGNPWASEKGGAPVAPGGEAWDAENE